MTNNIFDFFLKKDDYVTASFQASCFFVRGVPLSIRLPVKRECY